MHGPTIKAIKLDSGEWALDVLGVPFGSPTQLDSDGEYFSAETKTHDDKFSLPPAVYYHGYDDAGKPSGSPHYIGRTVSATRKADGVWYRVVLDKANEYARRVWEAAKQGVARASSGSLPHLVRKARDGHILEWPVAELSIFDAIGNRQPANQYAVALPVLKAMYLQAGISLPVDIDPSQETDGARAPGTGADADVGKDIEQPTKHESAQGQKGRRIMDPEDVKKMVADAIKADREAQAAAAKAQADQQAAVDAAVKAAEERWEADAAKGNRLPSGGQQAPYQTKYANLAKYDNLDVADHAALIDVLAAAKSKGHSQRGASIDAYRALAVKLGDSKEDNLRGARMTAKMAGVPMDAAKANELNQSTLANYGDEWVFTSHSNAVWERITQEDQILGRIPAIEVPQGSESVTIPLSGTPPTFYVTAQASAQAANPGAITNTVITSKMGTGNKVLSVKKLSGADVFTGELEEDSLIPWIPELRRNMQQEAKEVMSHIVIDGDTAAGATTNINDIGGTPAGTEAFMLFDGFRKLALVTNTANSRDGGVFALTDFLETLKLMGLAGRNAVDKTKVGFIIDLWTHWKSLELAQVATRDVFSAPTIEKGELINIYGHDVIHTANMHRANQDATYGLKANSAGKIDLDTAANNTTGAILAVRWDQWRLGYKRRWTFETERHALADATVIVMSSRVGMVNRDAEAAAETYNLTL
jgi:hypothetical protein